MKGSELTMAITASQVNELRQKLVPVWWTVRKLLQNQMAILKKLLRYLEKGASVASKRAEKSANEGMVITKLSDDCKKLQL